MKKRTLISGRKVNQIENEHLMTISSKCPDKWLFVDLETGDIWHVRKDAHIEKEYVPQWRQETLEELKELSMVTKRALDTNDYAKKKKK